MVHRDEFLPFAVQHEGIFASPPTARLDGTDRPFRPIRSDQPIQRRPTDPQFPRHLINVRHRQTFVAVPLQKTANRLFAFAALKPRALLFIIVKDAFFDIHFDRQLRPNVRRRNSHN